VSSFAKIEKELIVKFVKGVAIFLVLCLAAYGAFVIFKKPPQLNVPDSDISYLGDLGIHIQDGQASESGLSGVLNDVQGVAPVGTAGTPSSSLPPSFLVEPATSFAAPFEPAPRVAAASMQPALESSSSESVVFPPSNIVEPAIGVLPSAPPFSEAPPFEAPPIPITGFPPPTQSPPPLWETWDGPTSNIPATPPLAKPLQSITNSPAPELLPPITEQIVYQPIGKNIRRIASDSDNPSYSPSVTDRGFSTPDSIPLDTTPPYTRTVARQSLTFEPVKPEIQPNAPVLSFGHPKRTNSMQQHSAQMQPSLTSSLAGDRSEASANNGNPIAQPTAQTIVERFIQSQWLLVESGNPENTRNAFIQLSQLYEHSQLGEPARTMMLPILDMLALKVIYAKDTHILEPPYRVKPGETVESIARDFSLTPTLLRKINGLTMSHELSVGTTLKVLYGQFDARISFKRHELTLLLGGLYAGRFSFSLPHTGKPVHNGEFYVTNRTDQSIVLNNGWVLGTASTRNATIVFANQDAREIFDILSERSVIVFE